jgi:hypothetical protein
MLSKQRKNMTNLMTDKTVAMIDFIVAYLLLFREWLRPTPPEKPIVYRGGEPILPDDDVLKLQPRLVAELGEKKSLILQKFHEWTQVNKKKGTYSYKGETWTPGSYKDWNERHFNWFSSGYLGDLLSQLETSGYLITTTSAPFCYKGQKAYRLNYAKIHALMLKKVETPMKESVDPSPTKSAGVSEKVGHNKVVITSSLNNPFSKKQTNSLLTRGASSKMGSVGVVDSPKPDSGIFNFSKAETVTDGDAVQESNPTIEEEKADAQVWDAVKSKLEETWDRANYVTWLEPTKFLSAENGVYTIGAPNSYICDMLEYRLIDDLKPALVSIAGPDAQIEFRVHRHRPTLEELNQENPLFGLLERKDSVWQKQDTQSLQEQLCAWFDGMTETTAEELVEEYGEQWVRAVAQYARDNRQKLKNPTGFIISELKTNRLGLKPQQLAVAG